MRRELAPQIPLLKAHPEAQSPWRQQISLGTMEKGYGKASIASRRPTRSIITISKRWPEVGLINKLATGAAVAASCESGYRLLVRVLGVARGRGFAFAVLRTVIVPSLASAGVGDVSGYFFVVGQMSRHG